MAANPRVGGRECVQMIQLGAGEVAAYDPERAKRLGAAVLGCLLVAPTLWQDASGLDAGDFLLTDHQKICEAIAFLQKHDYSADIVSVYSRLGDSVEAGVLGALVEGVVVENFPSYLRQLRESVRDRHFQKLHQQMEAASTVEQRIGLLDQMRDVLLRESDDQNWRALFHTREEFENAPPLRFAIDGFLQEAGVTLIGGLAGHGKTLVMLAMVKALLEQSPLFGHEPLAVPRPAMRVLYLVPESSLGPFRSRVELFRLKEHVQSDRLLISTLSSRQQISLDDPRLLKAAEGADVFLDTAVRFMSGTENDVESARPFADSLFRVLNAGARSITGAHHAPKGFESQDYMTLENILRGSGDLGAMLCTCWGVRQIDAAQNQLYIQNVKPRDFQPPTPFILEARPHLDATGQFKMLRAPGEAGELREHVQRRGGRPAMRDKDEKIAHAVALRAEGLTVRAIAAEMGFGKSTVDRWLFHYDLSQKRPMLGQFRDSAEPDGETPN
jgi:hypothetical protein